MREIKFRGLVADEPNTLVHGYLMNKNTIYQTYEPKRGHCGVGSFTVIPESVGEYTGCRDLKGNKLYEHDIVVDKWEQFHLYYKIIFQKGKFKVMAVNGRCEGEVFENNISDFIKVGLDFIMGE